MDGDRHTPIAEHGLIGDMRSAALVGSDGRIDWFCCPRVDCGRALHTAVLARPAHEPGGASGGAASGPVATVAAFDGPGLRLVLTSSQPVVVDAGDAAAEFVLAPGHEATFVLEVLAGADRRAGTVPRDPVDVDALVGAILVF